MAQLFNQIDGLKSLEEEEEEGGEAAAPAERPTLDEDLEDSREERALRM